MSEGELPTGWAECTLGEIASFVMGQAPPGEQCNKNGVGTPFVKAGEFGSRRPIIREWTTKPLKMARHDDVLICVVGATVGKLNMGAECAIGRSVAAIRPKDGVAPEYIYRYLQPLIMQLRSQSSGSAQGVIGTSDLSEIPFRLAPSTEQQRIVSKIDELFSRIEAGKEALRRAQTLVERYRKSVLNAAVTGELTRDWREKNRDKIEPANKLLKRILKARREAWEAAELAKMKAKGKPPKDDNWKKRYAEPSPPDTLELPELPEGWAWANWDTVGYSQNGRPFPSSAYQDRGDKLLRPGNLYSDGSVKWTDKNTRCLPASYSEDNLDLIIGPRELVINLTAQSLKDEFLGRVCITGEGERCLLNQRLARLTPIIIRPEYMLLVFKSSLFRDFVSELNTGSLIQHMFTSQMGDFAFPVPPMEEQCQIIQRSSALIENANDLERCIGSQHENTTRLSQSVLRRAFEGKLVPQDATEEPASALLDRIRQGEQPSPSRRARK